jgi:hypothetical protein
VCQWPLTLGEAEAALPATLALGRAVCADPACQAVERERLAEAARQEAEWQAQKARLWAALEVERRRVIVAAGLEEEAWPLLALPSNRRALVPLKGERREAFREHSAKAIANALARPPEATEEAAEGGYGPRLVVDACTLCAGNCCQLGGDQAYMDVTLVDRYRLAFPEASALEIGEFFAGLLPERVYEGSCIFHGAAGCGLGEWRSRICKGHFCTALKVARAGGLERAWAVALTAGDPHWTRGPWPHPRDEMVRCGFIGEPPRSG